MSKPVTIVMLCHGRWNRTRRCLQSLRKNTPAWLYDIWVYDNASPDATAKHLRALQRRWPELKVFRNARNLTFASGVNAALAQVKGKFALLLNNDTVVSPGWLEGLVATARSDAAIAAAGPMTQYMAPPEQIAAPFANQRMVHAVEVPFLGGFCLLLKRRAFTQTGLFDERFAWGWEDIDYCLRLRQAGWRLAVARHVFVEHVGSATIKGLKARERRATDVLNRRLLRAKWLPREPGPGDVQRLFDASPTPWEDRAAPLASVIILSSGDWPRLQGCLKALRRNTPQADYEVLIADVSRDGRALPHITAAAKEWPEAVVLGRWDGAPYADAVNRAIRNARGEHFVLLAENVKLTPRWLPRMTRLAHSATNIGMVRSPSPGKLQTVYGSGTVLLIPRGSVERIGVFDDRFQGDSAQTDFGLRLIQAGYQVVSARAVPTRPTSATTKKCEAQDRRLLFQKWAGHPLFPIET